MLYLIHGDPLRGKRKLLEILEFFRAKAGDLGVFRFGDDNPDVAGLEELLRSSTLFGGKHAAACDRLLADPRAKKFVLENLERFALSPHVFVFFEEEPDKETLEAFRRRADKIQKFEKPPEKAAYNPFPLCDAFAARDRKRLWTLFRRAAARGVSAEEIFWKLWWQAKIMAALKSAREEGAKNPAEFAGVHPFAAKKALAALKNFKDGELEEIFSRLEKIYRKARNGEEYMEIGLEKLFLSV